MSLNLWALLFGNGSSATASGAPGVRPLEATFAARDFAVTFTDDPLMPSHVIITIGETREPIAGTLFHTVEGALARLPLAGATVTAHVRGITNGEEVDDVPVDVVNAAAIASDPDCGDIEIPLAGLADLETDQYELRFKADFGDGEVQWWPTKQHLALTVRPRFATT